ncbi:hypothetical protein LVD17_15175 [Fulvivirga ulvae]|uniref:LysM peptidoglycan-binding domain-containing protein n=1 Tax=Fulvivirga ulvae TaxID=2904245 RepID=UPI001F40FECC|nr:LysM peptidoglycan-binding domain-containing protein [Fulvivirga ulvae]UII29641.1 hypothetical protein LVD17_15175 [Fulvivirga ulvae]
MFEDKTPSPGSTQPHPLDASLGLTGALPESQPFFDPFAPQWDDEVNQRVRPRPKGSVPPFKSMYKNMPGMISKIDLNKVPGLLRIRDRDKSKEKPKKAPPVASHTTVPGDTLASLVSKYKVSEDALRQANADKVKKFKRNNGQGHLEGFDVGVELAIPSGEATPVKATTAPVTEAPSETQVEKGGMASTENMILEELVTTGASSDTAKEDKIKEGGASASAKMAENDLKRVKPHLTKLTAVAKKHGLPPALLAALASRETRAGKFVNDEGYGTYDPNGYGLLQVDKNAHTPEGEPFSEEHIEQAAGILLGMLEVIKREFPQWTRAEQLRGAIARYNGGLRKINGLAAVDNITTKKDYSADVWARARHYAGLEEFGGKGELPEIPTQATTIEEKEAAPEADTSLICSSVGRPSGNLKKEELHRERINYADDVMLIQDRLLELGLLSRADHSSERNAMVIPESTKSIKPEELFGTAEPVEKVKSDTQYRAQMAPEHLVATIKAIEVFQREVRGLSGKGVDGRIDPGQNTIKALMSSSMTAEAVQSARSTYAARKVEAEKKAEEVAAEKARIDAIRNEPVTEENIDRIIRSPRSTEGVAAYLSEYLVYNPKFVQKALERLGGGGAKKEVIINLLSISSDSTLMRCDIEVLETMKNAFNKAFLNYSSVVYSVREEQRQVERLIKLLERTKSLNLKDLAIEAVDNQKDQRKYRWNWEDKNAGTGVDCSHFIKEVVATAESEEARRLKQDKGYLTPEEINTYSKSFNDKNLKEFEDEERGTRRMARYLEKYGYYSTSLEDVKEGDIVFIGPGKEKSIGSIGHIVIIIEIRDTKDGKEYQFADAGMQEAKYVDGSYSGGGRSVRGINILDSEGIVWKGSKVERHFKGTGNLKRETK